MEEKNRFAERIGLYTFHGRTNFCDLNIFVIKHLSPVMFNWLVIDTNFDMVLMSY